VEKVFGRSLAALIFLVMGLVIGAGIAVMLFTSTITLTRTSSQVFTKIQTLTTTLRTMIVTTRTVIESVIKTKVAVKTSTLTLWRTETRASESWKTRTLGCESGYLITSYWTVREEFYRGEKVPVRDSSGKLLGYYRRDFLEDVMVEGWGKGDGVGNDGSYLGYDPELGFIKSPEPLDAYGSPLIPWKTVAAPTHLRKGTIILIIGFTSSEELSEDVIDKLLTSKFMISDRGASLTGRHIDIYVGEQDRADMNESPYALYIQNARYVFFSIKEGDLKMSQLLPSFYKYESRYLGGS